MALTEERAHYLKSVLRLRRGAELVVFNGTGGEFQACVEVISRAATRVKIGAFHPLCRESPLAIHLGLGISRGERMDLAIQKAVELGVTGITPLTTERSVVRLNSERRLTRWEHWQKVAQSACEQCHRNIVPALAEPRSLDEWLGECRGGLKLLLDPLGERSFKDLTLPSGGVCLLSGPEGGFSEDERARARAAGFLAIRLGPRVLRTETAALAALTAIQVLWGDLGAPVE